jgi:hypothetical protein
MWRHMEEHGNMKARLAALEARTAALEEGVTTLATTRNKAIGAWSAILVVGSVAGCLGAIVTRVFFH